jgi:hypothetical protein
MDTSPRKKEGLVASEYLLLLVLAAVTVSSKRVAFGLHRVELSQKHDDK